MGSCRWVHFFLLLCYLCGIVNIFISFTSVCLEEAQAWCTLIGRPNSCHQFYDFQMLQSWAGLASMYFSMAAFSPPSSLNISHSVFVASCYWRAPFFAHASFHILVFLNLWSSVMGWAEWRACLQLHLLVHWQWVAHLSCSCPLVSDFQSGWRVKGQWYTDWLKVF